jgi:hypothetical protein
MHIRVAGQAERSRRHTAPRPCGSAPNAINGSAATQGAPVQSSFTSCRRLKTANTDNGTHTAIRMSRQERSADVSKDAVPSRGGPPTRTRPAASSPVGVSRTRAAPTSLCSEKRGASARRRDVWKAKDAQSC